MVLTVTIDKAFNAHILKGHHVSRGFFHFRVKNVVKVKLNAFSHTRNTPRTSREGNQI